MPHRVIQAQGLYPNGIPDRSAGDLPDLISVVGCFVLLHFDAVRFVLLRPHLCISDCS